jgi:hypothetical protein
MDRTVFDLHRGNYQRKVRCFALYTILQRQHISIALYSTVSANLLMNSAKSGHGPHSSNIFVLFYVLFVLCRSVYCLCVNVYCTTATG